MARAHHSGASLRCSFGCDEIRTIGGASDPTAHKIASALRGATGWQAKRQ